MSYVVPPGTRIGHVHLKVSDLDKALAFYHELLGFSITQRYGSQAVFISAGGYHHHIGLNTWHSKGAAPAPVHACGLYHTAIVYSSRREFAEIVKRVLDAGYPLTGAADHGVSEAIYLNDPDGNGVELYWDKPVAVWPMTAEGGLEMVTLPLDMESVLSELGIIPALAGHPEASE
jgi:catechol 2,3-dioxygenase